MRVRDTNSISPLYICPSRRLDTEVITVWARLGVRQREREREGDTTHQATAQYNTDHLPPPRHTLSSRQLAGAGWGRAVAAAAAGGESCVKFHSQDQSRGTGQARPGLTD